MIQEACRTHQGHYVTKFLCCDMISRSLRHACTYPAATQKGVADLCLYQLECTCKCMCIVTGIKIFPLRI